MKLSILIIFFFLFFLSGLPSSRRSIHIFAASTTNSSLSWTLELENAVGDQATVNKMWCASPTGDLAFGPVQGADTSSPDASVWAVTQAPDQFLLHLRLPSTIDYSCRLETRLQTAPSSLWSFTLPLSILNQDGYASGDIKCSGPWHWAGVNPEDIPPGCQLYNADGYAMASVVLSLLTPGHSDATGATAPSSPMSSAPAPAPPPPPSSEDGSAISSSSSPTLTESSPAPTTAAAPTVASSPPPTSSSPSPTPAYSTAPAPPRKLLRRFA